MKNVCFKPKAFEERSNFVWLQINTKWEQKRWYDGDAVKNSRAANMWKERKTDFFFNLPWIKDI